MKWLFGTGSKTPKAPKRDMDPHVAVAALLVEAAMADGIYAELEAGRVQEVMRGSFGLEGETLASVLKEAEERAEGAAGSHRFTRHVKALAIEEREKVIEGLFAVALADGDGCPYEEAFIRQIAGLLYVDDVRRAEAKRRAEARYAG